MIYNLGVKMRIDKILNNVYDENLLAKLLKSVMRIIIINYKSINNLFVFCFFYKQ
jgi:hypothetical protein